jgi:hypothetical protein
LYLYSLFPASPCDRSHHRISGCPAQTASSQDCPGPGCPGFTSWRLGGVVLRRETQAGIPQRAGRSHLARRGAACSGHSATRNSSNGGASVRVRRGAVESGPAALSQSAADGRGIAGIGCYSGETGAGSAQRHDSGKWDRVLRSVDYQRQSGAASDHDQCGLEGAVDCGCAIKPGANRVFIGYYRLYQNSTVRARDSTGRTATFRDLGPRVTAADGTVGLRFEAKDFR